MSEAEVHAIDSPAHRLASVWQPTPLLKSLGNKHFVRVQDDLGHSAHFALSSYPQISNHALATHMASIADVPSSEETTGPDSAAENVSDSEHLKALRKQAFEEGLTEGRKQAEAELRERMAQDEQAKNLRESELIHDLLTQIQHGIESLSANPSLLHEPLKRLALHLAEQLVLTELNLSPRAIESLVQRCVQALGLPASTPLLVELNPGDLAMLSSASDGQTMPHWRLEANEDLRPGSVRVSANDAVVTDLVENRLAHLARELLDQPQRWEKQSAFSVDQLQQHLQNTKVQDVQAKNTGREDGHPSGMPKTSLHSFSVTRQDLDLNHPTDEPLSDEPDGDGGDHVS